MSMFSFGLSGNKESQGKKRNGEYKSMARYEQKLSEYRDTLERYKKCILEYAGKFDGIDKKSMENQLSAAQMEADLVCVRDLGERIAGILDEFITVSADHNKDKDDRLLAQGDKVLGQLENLMATVIETNYKMDGVDKNVVSRLSEILLELQKQTLFQYKQNLTEIQSRMDSLTKSVKRGRVWVILSFILQLLGLSALAFIILYLLEIIII